MDEKVEKKANPRADLGLIFIAAIWGVSFTVVKWSLLDSEPLANVCFRMAICALVLGILARRKGKAHFKTIKNGVILGILLAANFAFLTVGLKTTSASNTAFLASTFVIFVPFLSFLLYKEKITAKSWFASFVSLIGLWFISGGVSGISKGDIFILIAAVAGSCHIILVSKMSGEDIFEPFGLSFYQYAVATILIFLLILANGYRFHLGGMNNIIFLAVIAVIGNAFTIVGQLFAQKYMIATKAALIFALEPVFAALFAWSFGGEMMGLTAVFGGGLIVLGMVIHSINIPQKIKAGHERKD